MVKESRNEKSKLSNRNLIMIFVMVLGLIIKPGGRRHQLITRPRAAPPATVIPNPRESSDGRYVAFYSDATNLVSGLTVVNQRRNVLIPRAIRKPVLTRCLSISTTGGVQPRMLVHLTPYITHAERRYFFVLQQRAQRIS